MSFIAAAIVGAGAIGAGASIFGAYEQTQATKAAAQQVQQGQQQALGAIGKYIGPYATFGQQLQPTLQSLLTPGPSQTKTLEQLPGFQFARDMAGWGIQAGAGRTGISGTTAVEGGTLANMLAAQNWRQFVDPLVSLYGTGAQAAGTAGTSAANIATGTAGSLAQLTQGQGGIMAGAAGNIGNNLSNMLILRGVLGGASSNPSPTGPIPFLGGPFQGG